MTGGGTSVDTERRSFVFNPTTNAFAAASDLHTRRFYPTTVTLANGTALTLFWEDHANAPGSGVQSMEIFTPGGIGAWSVPKTLPFNYFYYPWMFLLPGGDLFIAGPQKPARRFNPTATTVVDNPANQYNQISSQRGVNMDFLFISRGSLLKIFFKIFHQVRTQIWIIISKDYTNMLVYQQMDYIMYSCIMS